MPEALAKAFQWHLHDIWHVNAKFAASINYRVIYRPVSGFGLLDVLPPEVVLLEVELLDEEELVSLSEEETAFFSGRSEAI